MSLVLAFIYLFDSSVLRSFLFSIFLGTREKSAFILLSHGGHLGFHEGGLLSTNPVSWLDRALIGLVGALVLSQSDSK